jgi:hypothetical protein
VFFEQRAGEALTVQSPTGLQALLAFVEPDVLAERLMGDIDRIADFLSFY